MIWPPIGRSGLNSIAVLDYRDGYTFHEIPPNGRVWRLCWPSISFGILICDT